MVEREVVLSRLYWTKCELSEIRSVILYVHYPTGKKNHSNSIFNILLMKTFIPCMFSSCEVHVYQRYGFCCLSLDMSFTLVIYFATTVLYVVVNKSFQIQDNNYSHCFLMRRFPHFFLTTEVRHKLRNF